MPKQELQVGDEIIVENYPMPFVVAKIGEKGVMARIKNFPFLVFVRKEKIIWRSPQTPEQIMRSLKGIEKHVAEIRLRKLREAT
jgi:hypothetical protein